MTNYLAAVRSADAEAWPSLPYHAWRDTYATLHMWTQIVGKVRMTLTPPQNHWWHAPLYVSARGLTSSLLPSPAGDFEIEFDLVDHELRLRAANGASKRIPLQSEAVASFYRKVMDATSVDTQNRPLMDG